MQNNPDVMELLRANYGGQVIIEMGLDVYPLSDGTGRIAIRCARPHGARAWQWGLLCILYSFVGFAGGLFYAGFFHK